MSERNNIVAAVDIGTNTIVCLIGRESELNRLEILGHAIVASSGVRRGVVLNIEETVEAVRNAVRKANQRLNYDIKKLYVNVGGPKLRTIERKVSKSIASGKIITKMDIKELFEEAQRIMLPEGDRIYHVINQSYKVDNEEGILNPIGIAGGDLCADYRLIVGPASNVAKLKTCLETAGFEMVRSIVNPIASAEAILTDDEKEAGVVVVDLGGGTTSISIYFDNVLRHISVIPFGGNVITNDIKEGCNILIRQAESLKVQYGQALGQSAPDNSVVTIPGINGWEPKEISFKSLSYIIQARMEEIIEIFFKQIDKSGYTDQLGAGIVLTGGGAKLQGLRQLVRYKTGMDVRVGSPIIGLSSDMGKIIESPQFATAYGLLKKAYRDTNAQNAGQNVSQNEEMINTRKKKKEPAKTGAFGDKLVQKLSLFFNEEQDSEL
jgi:cell division protein FtsA